MLLCCLPFPHHLPNYCNHHHHNNTTYHIHQYTTYPQATTINCITTPSRTKCFVVLIVQDGDMVTVVIIVTVVAIVLMTPVVNTSVTVTDEQI